MGIEVVRKPDRDGSVCWERVAHRQYEVVGASGRPLAGGAWDWSIAVALGEFDRSLEFEEAVRDALEAVTGVVDGVLRRWDESRTVQDVQAEAAAWSKNKGKRDEARARRVERVMQLAGDFTVTTAGETDTYRVSLEDWSDGEISRLHIKVLGCVESAARIVNGVPQTGGPPWTVHVDCPDDQPAAGFETSLVLLRHAGTLFGGTMTWGVRP